MSKNSRNKSIKKPVEITPLQQVHPPPAENSNPASTRKGSTWPHIFYKKGIIFFWLLGFIPLNSPQKKPQKGSINKRPQETRTYYNTFTYLLDFASVLWLCLGYCFAISSKTCSDGLQSMKLLFDLTLSICLVTLCWDDFLKSSSVNFKEVSNNFTALR